MNQMIKCFCAAFFFTVPALAEGERAGEFDYYVLSLSWNPTWCELTGDDRDADQCDARHEYGFTLHGLWPQSEVGWPSYCRTNASDPSRADTSAMSDIMGSAGLAWHQWKKHGRCAGMSSDGYFEASRTAYDSISRPDVFRLMNRGMSLPPEVVEDAFLEANPDLRPEGIAVTCKFGKLQEVRICLNRDLNFRECGPSANRRCSSELIYIDPIR